MSGDGADGMPPPDCIVKMECPPQVCGVGAVPRWFPMASTALVVTKMCSTCNRPKPVDQFSARAKSTCSACVTKKKRQHANKRRKEDERADVLYNENNQFPGIVANQVEEMERLRNALDVLRRDPARVSTEVLNQLHEDPSVTAAFSCFSKVLDSTKKEEDQAVPNSSDSGVTQPGLLLLTGYSSSAVDTAEESAVDRICPTSDRSKRLYAGSGSQSKKQKQTVVNSYAKSYTCVGPDLDLDLFEVPWLDPETDSSAGIGTGSGVGDGNDEQASEDSTEDGAQSTEHPDARSALQKWVCFGFPLVKNSPLQHPAVLISALVVTISHYMLHIDDVRPQLESLSILLATQQFSSAICYKFAALVGCVLAAYACIRPPGWLDSLFVSLSLKQEGVQLEQVASAQKIAFASVVFIFCAKPIWLHTDFDMWLDPSVAPLAFQAVVIPALTIGFMYNRSCWMVQDYSHISMLNLLTQFRRWFLLLMAPMSAASTNSDPLLRFLFSNCVLHISYDQHLLDSLWILFWMIACWPQGEELMWLVCAVLGSFVCLAAKLICIQKFYHPEDRLGSSEDLPAYSGGRLAWARVATPHQEAQQIDS